MSGEPPYVLPSALVHDLRTPLGHIIGYAELLLEELEQGGQDDYLPHVAKVRAAGYELLALMERSFRVADEEQ